MLHFVEPQQTLYSLAIEYDVNMDSIRMVNGGLPDGLKVGTTIRIPLQAAPDESAELSSQLAGDLPEMPVILDSSEIEERVLGFLAGSFLLGYQR